MLRRLAMLARPEVDETDHLTRSQDGVADALHMALWGLRVAVDHKKSSQGCRRYGTCARN